MSDNHPLSHPLAALFLFAAACASPAADAPTAAVASAPVASTPPAVSAGDVVRHGDLAYQSLPGVDPARQALDVFAHPALKSAPVIVFFHGGSWRQGDKRAVGRKPGVFAQEGYLTVSANYRFRPDVSLLDQVGDCARAVAWVRANIGRYGGDPDRIVLMGHSAGAHLAAVLATNPDFLEAAGVPMKSIIGAVPLDTGPYDVALQLRDVNPETGYGQMLNMVFGEGEDVRTAVSPMKQTLAGAPPFLVVSSDNRGDVRRQAIPFVEALKAAGVRADWHEAEGLNHEGVNSALGDPAQPIAERVGAFLRSVREPVRSR